MAAARCRVSRSARQAQDFTAIDKQNFRIERKLTDGKELSLHQGGSLLGRWPIEIVPDNPPTIAFANPPGTTARAALRLDFQTADDYGVASAKAVIQRPHPIRAKPTRMRRSNSICRYRG